jgi:hypothetical protein
MTREQARTGLLAGLIAGFVAGGVGSRVAMRVIALSAGLPPTFSIAGTLNVLVLPSLAGTAGGLAYGLLHQNLRSGVIGRGLAFAALLLGIFGGGFLVGAGEGELALGPPGLALALFMGLFVVYAILVALCTDWLERRGGRHAAGGVRRDAGWYLLEAIGTLGVVLISMGFVALAAFVLDRLRT